MNWPSYKFCKESEPELIEFLKVSIQKNNQSLSPELVQLWQRLVPIDEDVLQKIATIKSSEIDCIDITSSDDEAVHSDFKLKPTDQHLPPDLNVISPPISSNSTDDLIDSVKELLESGDSLTEDIIQQFGRKYSQRQLEDMFTLFSKELNKKCILKLWESISSCNKENRDFVAAYFSRCILSSKLVSEDINLKEILNDMFNKVPNVVASDITRVLNDTSDNKKLCSLRKHLDVLSDSQKNQLLDKFLQDCVNLEDKHITNILALFTKRCDLNNLNNIVDIMYNHVKEFVTNKNFGKLLIEVLEKMGSNVNKCEPQLKHIISKHKSIYSTKIIIILIILVQAEIDQEHIDDDRRKCDEIDDEFAAFALDEPDFDIIF